MTATLHRTADDTLLLKCSVMLTDLAKQVPGARPDRTDPTGESWRIPLSPIAVDIVWSVFRGQVELDRTVIDYMGEHSGLVQQLAANRDGMYRDGFIKNYPAVAENLWPLQVDGVLHLATAKTAYLCDEMGAGKTIQCYRALDYLDDWEQDPYPALVVANKSALRTAWFDEAARWSRTAESVVVVDGTAPQRRKALDRAAEEIAAGVNTVIVVGWGALSKHTRLDPYGNISLKPEDKEPKELNAIPFRTVIADESHKAKEWKTQRTRALWAVAHAPEVEYRWALTGTPVTGFEQDLWGIGHFVQPDFYPRKTQWEARYVDVRTLPGRDYPIVVGFRQENYDEMIRHFDPYLMRRLKAEIIPNYQGKLPVKTVEVEMGAKQKKLYKQMADDMFVVTDTGALAAVEPIEQLLRLNVMAAATPVIEQDDEGVAQVTALTMPSCKVDAALEIMEELGDRPAVMFAESKLLINLMEEQLKAAGYDVMRVTGDEDSTLRAANIRAFQNGDVQVALCTYGAGAESITLNQADTVVRLQRTYRFDLDTQAPDRVDRGERTVPVQVIDLVTLGTSEHGVHNRIEEKYDNFQQVVRDHLREVYNVQ